MRAKIVWRSGEELREPYARHQILGAIPLTDDLPPAEVPVGRAFLMGDNRDKVVDSRLWGAIPFSAIKGRVVGITKPGG